MSSPQQQSDWQRRFQDLKIGLNNARSNAQNLNEIEVDIPNFEIDKLQQSYQQFIIWFNNIPASGKLLAIAAGGLLSLTLIKTVFQLITSLITLSVVGIILYLVYRFWVLPKGSE